MCEIRKSVSWNPQLSTLSNSPTGPLLLHTWSLPLHLQNTTTRSFQGHAEHLLKRTRIFSQTTLDWRVSILQYRFLYITLYLMASVTFSYFLQSSVFLKIQVEQGGEWLARITPSIMLYISKLEHST